jgi:hypothetical protein
MLHQFTFYHFSYFKTVNIEPYYYNIANSFLSIFQRRKLSLVTVLYLSQCYLCLKIQYMTLRNGGMDAGKDP